MKTKTGFAWCILLGFLGCSMICAAEEKAEKAQDKVWAKIGDEVIDEEYLELQIKLSPRIVQQRYGKESLRPAVVKETVEKKMFAFGGRRAGLEQKPEIQFRIKDSIERILAEAYVEHLREGVVVAEEEVRLYYEKNLEKYRTPEQMKLRHIVVKDPVEARKILTEIRKGGDFAKIAGEKSLYLSKKKDGDLGWVGRGSLQSKLEEKVFKMKKGDLSDVIQIDEEYHIVRVEDYKESQVTPLEEVGSQIEHALLQDKKRQVVEDTRNALRKELNVQFFFPEKAASAGPSDAQGAPGRPGRP